MDGENENVGLDPNFDGEKTEGYERVDTSTLPPNIAKVVEARLGRYHRQVKESQKQLKETKALIGQLAEDNKALMARLDTMDSKEIKQELKQAIDEGDSTKAATLTEKLTELKSEKPKAPPKVEVQEDPGDLSDYLTPEEEVAFREWASEKDESGFKRGWLEPSHPKNKRAMGVLQGLLADDELKSKGAMAVMKEWDKAMGVEVKPRSVPPVLSGGSAPRSNGKSPALTALQKQAADAMGVSHEAYSKSLASTPKNDAGRTVYIREYN